MASLHPARMMTFAEVSEALASACAAKLVSEVADGDLRLYCYTKSCVYDRAWSDTTMLARGLVLDVAERRVVATPFPKFFNIGEGTQTVPDLPFEAFDKLDGSLIIIFWHGGEWRTATKGALASGQAKWAAQWMRSFDLTALERDTTYLAEAVYPENRIVIHYDQTGLVLLAAYNEGGEELRYDELCAVGERLGWPVAPRRSFASVSDLIAKAATLPASEEGFVLRFANGLRLKVKGDEYRRIHALVSRVTPLAMWEALQAGDDMNAIRRDLPEEFWTDFDQITGLIRQQVARLIAETKQQVDAVAGLTDKDVGLRLPEFPADVRSFIFPYRKSGDLLANSRSRAMLYRAIRPTGNSLAGYTPSYGVQRVLEESA